MITQRHNCDRRYLVGGGEAGVLFRDAGCLLFVCSLAPTEDLAGP